MVTPAWHTTIPHPSEAENRRKIDLAAEARNVPSRPLMNVTITG